MSPLLGVCGETGDVLALRARCGNASPAKKLASFIDECVAAIPKEIRGDYQLWLRIGPSVWIAAAVIGVLSL
jgi:hypothetical protein